MLRLTLQLLVLLLGHADALVRGVHIAPALRARSVIAMSELPKTNTLKVDISRVVEPARKALGLVRGETESQRVSCSEFGGDDNEECLALCDSEGCAVVGRSATVRTIKIGIYFALWFALSTGYNIANKVRLNALAMPWSHSAASLAVGSSFVSFLWMTGLRKPPKLSAAAVMTLAPIAFCHSIGHIGAVVSAGAGAVSFTQIVKAAEPVFTCGLSALLLGQTVSAPVAISLIPIVFGVALASVSELSFTWTSFFGAMLSNLAFAARNILSRASMDKPKGENMTPENLFGVLTVMSFMYALPLALAMEGPKALATWAAASQTVAPAYILKYTISTGLYFYLYNEVAMLALNNVHPVTHAVANTIKRVVILLACVLIFRTPMTPMCSIGSAIAIIGSYFYSMAKGKDKAAKAAKTSEEPPAVKAE